MTLDAPIFPSEVELRMIELNQEIAIKHDLNFVSVKNDDIRDQRKKYSQPTVTDF